MRSPNYIYNKIKRITLMFIYSTLNNRDGQIRLTDKLVKQLTTRFAKFYSADSPMLELQGKSVIAIADKIGVGLSDRLRGTIFVYNCVKELNDRGACLDFKIIFDKPFSLINYLEPNLHEWSIDSNEVSYNSSQAEGIGMGCSKLTKHGFTTELSKEYLMQRVEGSGCNQVHIYTNMKPGSKEVFSAGFHELFRPSDRLQEVLNSHYTELKKGNGYISVTLRFQNLLGDFFEGNSFKPLSSEEKKSRLIEQCTAQIEKLHRKYPNKRVLVTSDSRLFLDSVATLAYIYTTKGKIIHLGHTTDSSFESHLKPFVDLFTIAEAEKIYLLRTGKMYDSGFPRTAAMINNRPFEKIEF